MMFEILMGLFFLSTAVMLVYLARHYVFTLTVLRRNRTFDNSKIVATGYYEPTVSILIPARNEEYVIGKLLQQIAELNYPHEKMQVIVIDDASSDRTGEIIEVFAKRYDFIKVLHREKEVGGKGKASVLNFGLQFVTGEIVLFFDADYFPQRDIVNKLVREFIDLSVGAVQGRPVVFNESQTIVTRIVTLERIGGYRVGQEARDVLGLTPQFGGTIGGFRRSVLKEIGGFDESVLAEDTDLTFQVRLLGLGVSYVGDAECYEEAVCTWKAYWNQRHRWAKGHMQVCFKHSLSVLKSKKMTWKQKVDCLLLLHIYFVPVLTMLSFLAGASLVLFESSALVRALWFVLPLSFYSCVGNFAPFFEVGIGAYLDGRKRLQWLVPLLIFAYLFNVLICTKAFLDVSAAKIFGRGKNEWSKTKHVGIANRYNENQLLRGKRL
ncbi:MAG TPA: glycosyltransferase family 2 protein [Candidatus Bathyarchaeia archaeon]